MSDVQDPGNRNRLDLYRRLLWAVREEDQKSGTHGYEYHWDESESEWSEDDPSAFWDDVGLRPVIQELFYVIEQSSGEELEVLESLDALTDPMRCPESFLSLISSSLGYQLSERLDEDAKRTAVMGLIRALKSRGVRMSFKAFYRLIGLSLIDVYPLWKKMVEEPLSDYSRYRYDTSAVSGESLGSALASYSGKLAQAPVKPGTLLFSTGTVPNEVFIRDNRAAASLNADGTYLTAPLIGNPGGIPAFIGGTIDYRTGEYALNFSAVTPQVFVNYEYVEEEWPYHAARVDVELLLNVAPQPIPLVDEALINDIFVRLEEVRPIHVLVRTFTLAMEVEDVLTPMATDMQSPIQHVWYHYDGLDNHGFISDGRYDIPDQVEVGIRIPPADEHQLFINVEDTADIVYILDGAVIEAPYPPVLPEDTQYV